MREHFARWTCNVCGITAETLSTEQPKGWVGYGFSASGTPDGEKNDLGHLCDECATAVAKTMGRPR